MKITNRMPVLLLALAGLSFIAGWMTPAPRAALLTVPDDVPVAASSEFGSVPLGGPEAITTLLTLGLTYGARKWLGDEKLKGKPHVLSYASMAASLVGGFATTALSGGLDLKHGASAAIVGWMLSQGVRRVKKAAGIA